MDLPTHPLILEAEQVEDLARHFSAFRHDVNGCLALVVAATELIRYNASVVNRMASTLIEQPSRIAGKTREFASQCERALGMRKEDEPSWYLDMWKRYNAAAGDPSSSISLSAEEGKRLHGELLAMAKELSQLAFTVSGASSLTSANPLLSDEVTRTAAEQLPKVTRKFATFADAFEAAMRIEPPAPKRLISGAPSGSITLAPEDVALFHRRLENLQRDIAEHLAPLVELSRLARENPAGIPARAQEFAQQPPKLSEEINRFATDFDRTFQIVRAAM